MTDKEDQKFISGEESDNYPVPYPEPKHNTHTFLIKVLEAKDTTKVAFLSEEELGVPKQTVRGLQNNALMSEMICENPFLSDMFASEAEIVLATSLSRNGKLLTSAITQKRTIADETKIKKPNSGWFTKKDKKEDEE